MELTPERRGEIALAYLKHKLFRDGIKLSKDTSREIVNTAKQVGISEEEAVAFAEELTRELVDKVFAPKERK